MVSSKLTADIKQTFEALKNQTLEIHDYSPPLFDVVFEIYTADTFIAGVASKLIDNETVAPEERAILKVPLMAELRWWRRDNGELFDLQPYPDVSDAALAIENLRLKCYAALGL